MTVTVNTRELDLLAAQLLAEGPKQAAKLRPVVQASAQALTAAWRANASQTAGAHGKHYPASIDFEIRSGGMSAEIGPDASHPQGGMSFEYGSVNQPPHLDGNRATDVFEPLFVAAVIRVAGQGLL